MLIPRVMKGLEKSITFSLSDVMVKPATARSAFCGGGVQLFRLHLPPLASFIDAALFVFRRLPLKASRGSAINVLHLRLV